MKIHRLLLLGGALSTPAMAQDSFTIAWSTISGGSGASAGPAEFTLAGSSVGQLSAGKSPGEPGEFDVSGGYWTFEFEPPPPLDLNLRMQLDGGTVTLTWDDSGPPAVLESSTDLQLWEAVDPQPAAPPFIEPEGARRYYRLTRAVK
jgi:hypothetical protein